MRRPAVVIAFSLLVFGCGETAKHAAIEGYGPNPVLPEPTSTLFPTVNVAEATSWPAGSAPTPLRGLRVNAFASCLAHPRSLDVLPNGDLLRAGTNKPPPPEDK